MPSDSDIIEIIVVLLIVTLMSAFVVAALVSMSDQQHELPDGAQYVIDKDNCAIHTRTISTGKSVIITHYVACDYNIKYTNGTIINVCEKCKETDV
jgi:hypothetical protein